MLIPKLAARLDLKPSRVIDLFTPLGGISLSQESAFCNKYVCDKIHPDSEGERIIADTVYKAITNADDREV